jgi:hypothetical protein
MAPQERWEKWILRCAIAHHSSRQGAPRNDNSSFRHISTFPRRPLAPRLCKILALSHKGAENAGCQRTRLACRMKTAHERSHYRSTENTGIPCAMVLTVYSRLSPAIGLFASIPAQCAALSRVDPSIGASGPHGFAVRLPLARPARRPASTAPCPAFVAIASRPSVSRTGCTKAYK